MRTVVVLVLALAIAPQAHAQSTPHSLTEILELVGGAVPTPRILGMARENCIAFRVDAAAETRLRRAGADAALISGLRSACVRVAAAQTARRGLVHIEGELPPHWLRSVNGGFINTNRTIDLTPGRPATIVVTAFGYCADQLEIVMRPGEEQRWTPVLRERTLRGDCAGGAADGDGYPRRERR